MGTILSLAAFRGAGAKENGPCPSFPPSPAFTFSNIMKSVTCEKFKIQPSFPPLSPPRPLAFSDVRLLLYFSPRLFACAREKRGRGQSVENISLLSSMMETIPNFRILLRHTHMHAHRRAQGQAFKVLYHGVRAAEQRGRVCIRVVWRVTRHLVTRVLNPG